MVGESEEGGNKRTSKIQRKARTLVPEWMDKWLHDFFLLVFLRELRGVRHVGSLVSVMQNY